MKSLRDYINILAEADAPAAGGRAQYDQFKSEDAKKEAIGKIKKLAAIPINAIPRLGWAIDPSSGIIYYNNGSDDSGGPARGNPAPYGEAGKFWDFNSPAGATSEAGQLGALVRQAGLEVIPVAQKGLFGSFNVAAVDVNKLRDIDKAPVEQPPAPNASAGDQADQVYQGADTAPADDGSYDRAEANRLSNYPANTNPAQQQGGMTQTPTQTAPAQQPDPKVLYIQQTLKRLGADLGKTGPNKDGVDGIMGDKTRTAMKKYNIDASGANIAKPNPDAPATGTQSNAVTTAAASGNRAGDVETGGGAFMGNTNIMQADAKIAKIVANAPIDPATKLPVDWPKWPLNYRRVYNNLEREKARAGQQAVVPASQTPPQPGAPVKESGYGELERLVSLIHYR